MGSIALREHWRKPLNQHIQEGKISVANDLVKVIEVLAESDKSWEHAAQQAVARAAKTVHGIKSIYIKNFEAKVVGDKIVKYRINANLSFLLD